MLYVPDAPYPSPLDVVHAMERGERLAVRAGQGVFLISPEGVMHRLDENDPFTQTLLGHEREVDGS